MFKYQNNKIELIRHSKKQLDKLHLKNSIDDFYNKLLKGHTEIGSIHFNKCKDEIKAIKQICRYFGYKLIEIRDIDCQYPECLSTFKVTHYYIKKQN